MSLILVGIAYLDTAVAVPDCGELKDDVFRQSAYSGVLPAQMGMWCSGRLTRAFTLDHASRVDFYDARQGASVRLGENGFEKT